MGATGGRNGGFLRSSVIGDEGETSHTYFFYTSILS
jgi:hypothetical protein